MTFSLQNYREQALTALVIVEALWLFVLAPLTQLHVFPAAVNVLITVVIVAIVLVICSGTRGAEIAIIAATLVDMVAQGFHAVAPSRLTIGCDLAARIVFFGALTWVVANAVFGPGRVTIHRIVGAIAIELTIAMMFALVFRSIDLLTTAGAFQQAGAQTNLGNHGFGRYVYFSLTTLTSTSYGDLVPVHPFARSIANLEALVGQLFPATLLARLVSLEIESRRSV
jgi:uncharacterized protein YhhL (DUF1145 family)